jgi:hypothetical protein
MKVPAHRVQLPQQRGEIFEMLGNDVAHLAGLAGAFIDVALPHAVDRQQARLQDFGALALMWILDSHSTLRRGFGLY